MSEIAMSRCWIGESCNGVGSIAFLRGICYIQIAVFHFATPISSVFTDRVVGIDTLFMVEKDMPTTLSESRCKENCPYGHE
jgi:hypothetical protein